MPTPTHKLENFPTSSEFLSDALKSNSFVGRVWVFDEIASTQTFLEGVENLTIGDLAVARHQTEGRGRLERRWNDVQEGSILLSLALPVSEVLTLAVGVGVLRALSTVSSALTLKWPNDIVIVENDGYRKIGGIITTRKNDSLAIAGIGINLIAPEGELQACGLLDLTDTTLNVTKIVASIIDQVSDAVMLDQEEVIQQFRLKTSTIHRDVRIQSINGKSIYGHVADIADDGALLIDTDNGQIRMMSGDVSYVRFAEH